MRLTQLESRIHLKFVCDPVLNNIFNEYFCDNINQIACDGLIQQKESIQLVKRQKKVTDCHPGNYHAGTIFLFAWKGLHEEVEHMLEHTLYTKEIYRHYVHCIYAYKKLLLPFHEDSISQLEKLAYYAGLGDNVALIDKLCAFKEKLLRPCLAGAYKGNQITYNMLRQRLIPDTQFLQELEPFEPFNSRYYIGIGLLIGLCTQFFF